MAAAHEPLGSHRGYRDVGQRGYYRVIPVRTRPHPPDHRQPARGGAGRARRCQVTAGTLTPRVGAAFPLARIADVAPRGQCDPRQSAGDDLGVEVDAREPGDEEDQLVEPQDGARPRRE